MSTSLPHSAITHSDQIPDTGLTIIHEPTSTALVDIVLVHGLQGHPYRTWACPRYIDSSSSMSGRPKRRSALSILLSFRPRNSSSKEGRSPSAEANAQSVLEPLDNVTFHKTQSQLNEENHFYWPRDALPAFCPEARILVWGYDTRIVRGFGKPTHKNTIYSHGKDLLYDLGRSLSEHRPFIFIAHSLGGIIVKQMLDVSVTSENSSLRKITKLTKAIVFLGTPHRGSVKLAKLGERVRRLLEITSLDTSPAILDALAMKTSDLARCQESFSSIWAQQNFRVKTFQEGLGLIGISFRNLNQKVVEDFSSSLGDSREEAETLPANHKDICRFRSQTSPTAHKVLHTIKHLFQDILTQDSTLPERAQSSKAKVSARDLRYDLSTDEQEFLQFLSFPGMFQREQQIKPPTRGTCEWLFDHPIFLDWQHRRNVGVHQGLLWIKGNPGSGKSTALRQAFKKLTLFGTENGYPVAVFFFNAKGPQLHRSLGGLYRSLLYQLLPSNTKILKSALERLGSRVHHSGDTEDDFFGIINEYENILRKLLGESQGPRKIILIDALDECDNNKVRRLADFFRELTYMAYDSGQELNVCLSSRTGSAVPVKNCPVIQIDKENLPDIKSYMEFKFDAYLSGAGSGKNLKLEKLVTTVAEKSSGIFLWVSLVVDMLLKELDKGTNLKGLEERLEEVPLVLQDLYTDLLKNSPTDHDLKRQVFQWAIFGGDLRLREWQHLLPLLEGSPTSLRGCRESRHWAETEIQLENQIRHLSMGLIEVNTPPEINKNEFDLDDSFSITGIAGSMDLELGETRMVQVIHDTVRDWFVSGPGLKICRNPRGVAYLGLIHTCLDFIAFKEFDLLAGARLEQQMKLKRSDIKPHEGEDSRIQDRGERADTPDVCQLAGARLEQQMDPKRSDIKPHEGEDSRIRDHGKRADTPDVCRLPADTPDNDIGSFSSAASHLYASSIASHGSSLGPRKMGQGRKIVIWGPPNLSNVEGSTWAPPNPSDAEGSICPPTNPSDAEGLIWGPLGLSNTEGLTRGPLNLSNAEGSIKANSARDFDQSATSTWKENSFSPEKDITTPEEMQQYRLNYLFTGQAEREFVPNAASHDIKVSEVPSTRVLEKYTYPPLLDFVLARLPAFVELASDTGIDPGRVLLRLHDPSQWQRFVCLRENMPYDLDFESWLDRQNIYDWKWKVKGLPPSVGSL